MNSKDPRKAKIVAALKKKSGGRKVTLVQTIGPGRFKGHCQRPNGAGGWLSLGMFEVDAIEAGLCK